MYPPNPQDLLGAAVQWSSQAAGVSKSKHGIVVAAAATYQRDYKREQNGRVRTWLNEDERLQYEMAPRSRQGESRFSDQPLIVKVTAVSTDGAWRDLTLPEWYCPRPGVLVLEKACHA